MSKLDKFFPSINVTRASALLGELIGERLTHQHLTDMNRIGYLDAYLDIRCDGVEVILGADGWKTSDKVAFQTNEVMTPCEYIVFGDLLALSVRDEQNRTYIFYPEKSDTPLHVRSPELEDNSIAYFHPDDIYLVANYANTPGILDWNEKELRSFYVYTGHDSDPWMEVFSNRPTPEESESIELEESPQEPPSFRLAVAALLDLLSESQRPARNQDGIKKEILERYSGFRGLGGRNLDTIFSAANKAMKDAMARR